MAGNEVINIKHRFTKNYLAFRNAMGTLELNTEDGARLKLNIVFPKWQFKKNKGKLADKESKEIFDEITEILKRKKFKMKKVKGGGNKLFKKTDEIKRPITEEELNKLSKIMTDNEKQLRELK